MSAANQHAGILHAFVAFDWGDAIDLDHARRLQPGETHTLPRRRRTPSSFHFHPAPLRIELSEVFLTLPEIGDCQAQAVVTLFDFAAISLDLNVAYDLSAGQLVKLAGWLAEPQPIVALARSTLKPLYERLKPAIRSPEWNDLVVEEYFVFQMTGNTSAASEWLAQHRHWLGQVLRRENDVLSEEELADAVRLRASYTPDDLFMPDWGAAVLRDRDCEETLQVIEFANLQLLELRHIDDRLDAILMKTDTEMMQKPQPIRWHGPTATQRLLGEMSVEASTLFERSTNVIKLVGDPYLARVYRLVAERFRLSTWESAVQRKLETLQGIYEIVTDQAEAARSVALELIVILLIAVEVVLGLIRH